MKMIRLAFCLAAALLGATRLAFAADDDKLALILIPGEDWQVVAEDLGFADGSSADADGNLYFSDLRSKPPVIYKVAPDGTKTKIAEAGMSGTKMGPDGRLYGCGGGKVVAFELPSGKATVIAEGFKTNDIAITHKGFIYLTETGKSQVTFVDIKTGQARPADIGISKPNGIAVTPDQTHLLVSDYGGLNVWSFAIQPDGSLADKKPLMTMKAPEKKPTVAGGDGMIVDSAGRSYVTTALGLQIFAADGTLLGILPKPQEDKPLTNAAFAGTNLQYLYVSNGTKVFRRKTQAKGVLSYLEPPAQQK